MKYLELTEKNYFDTLDLGIKMIDWILDKDIPQLIVISKLKV